MITWISNVNQLWDFWTVKMATIASVLGTMGFGLQYLPPDTLPHWVISVCQVCGLAITMGIVPARGVRQLKITNPPDKGEVVPTKVEIRGG